MPLSQTIARIGQTELLTFHSRMKLVMRTNEQSPYRSYISDGRYESDPHSLVFYFRFACLTILRISCGSSVAEFKLMRISLFRSINSLHLSYQHTKAKKKNSKHFLSSSSTRFSLMLSLCRIEKGRLMNLYDFNFWLISLEKNSVSVTIINVCKIILWEETRGNECRAIIEICFCCHTKVA